MLEPEFRRHVSRLTKGTLALVLAGGRGSRLYELTDWRAKPAVPFGGKFRIVDFPLSNCVNSGIRRIGVLTQYKSHSLVRHMTRGWSGFQTELNEFVEILPASQRVNGEWYQGTADAIYQNLDILRTHRPEYVIVLSGDHIYKMDYGQIIAAHVANGADMTISCLEVPLAEAAGSFGVMKVNADHQVVAFEEKPANPSPSPDNPELCLASMGNYVFNTSFLYEQLIKDADDPESSRDFGHDIIPKVIDEHRIFAFPFRESPNAEEPFWRDVGTIDAFWEANLELVQADPQLNLYDQDWPILTYQAQLPPAKFVHDHDDRRGKAIDSMVSGGCIISGSKVVRSLLFSNVKVNSYSLIEDSVVLPDVVIKRHVKIRRAVIDTGCVIPEGMEIGLDHDADRARGFRVTDKGIVLVTPDMLDQPIHFRR